MKTPQPLWTTCSRVSLFSHERFFLCLNGISCISICAHFLLSIHGISLHLVRFSCLLIRSTSKPSLLQGKQPVLSLTSYERCSRPLIIFVAPYLTHSSISLSLFSEASDKNSRHISPQAHIVSSYPFSQSTSIPKSFSAGPLSTNSSCSPCCYWGLP